MQTQNLVLLSGSKALFTESLEMLSPEPLLQGNTLTGSGTHRKAQSELALAGL